MSDIYKEFGVDFLRTRYAGPTAAEMEMAQEITRLRARVAELERQRPSRVLKVKPFFDGGQWVAANERIRADGDTPDEALLCFDLAALVYLATTEAKP
jgi:hypothetical protein